MPNPRALSLVLLLGAACSHGPQVRVLSSEPSFVTPPHAEAEERDDSPKPAPRIGAPGGSGSGSRSVVPVP